MAATAAGTVRRLSPSPRGARPADLPSYHRRRTRIVLVLRPPIEKENEKEMRGRGPASLHFSVAMIEDRTSKQPRREGKLD
jgi:hypothetical protein